MFNTNIQTPHFSAGCLVLVLQINPNISAGHDTDSVQLNKILVMDQCSGTPHQMACIQTCPDSQGIISRAHHVLLLQSQSVSLA